MEMSWLIAVLLAAMASFISNLGVTLQKLHHLRSASVDSRGEGGDYTKGWMWRVGLGLVFFGSLADFAALSFGPQSLVAPLGSLTLVSNVIFAPLLLKETIGHWDVFATVLIVVGSSVAVMFGSHEAVVYTVWQLFSFFTRWDFILYAMIISVAIFMLYSAIQKIEQIEKDEGVHSPHYLHYKALHRFAYPALSGTVGAQSVLFAKCFVELLSNTVKHFRNGSFVEDDLPATPAAATTPATNGTDGLPSTIDTPAPSQLHSLSQNMFVHWQTYFVFFAMLGAIFSQIKYLNEGLKRFDASYAVPVFTSFWIILSVLSGMIFYREYSGMDTMQCLMFAFGVFMTVTGVITLGGREQAHHQHQVLNNEEEGDEEGNQRNGDGHHHHHHHVEDVEKGSINQSGSSEPSSKHHHHHHHHQDENLELDLDLEGDLEDHSSVNGSSHPGHVKVHAHLVHVAPAKKGERKNSNASNEDESSVVDGAKTAALEASQRISQAFSKLRGKGERDAIASIQGSSSVSASSHNRKRSVGTSEYPHHDSDPDVAGNTTDDESADPLILKKGGGQPTSRKSPSHAGMNFSTNTTPTATQSLPTTPSINANASSSYPSSTSNSSVTSIPANLRQSSLTPTFSSLYDPSPLPNPSLVLNASSSGQNSRKTSEAGTPRSSGKQRTA